jgi:hypothetical protein
MDESQSESPQHLLRKSLAHWSGWSTDRVEPAAAALESYDRELRRLAKHEQDDNAPPLELDKLEKRVGVAQNEAIERLDPVLGAGLKARHGRYVRSWAALVKLEAAHDWAAWRLISTWLYRLDADNRSLYVCESCTVVFAPRRKSSARVRYCPTCKHHPIQAPPLGWGPMPAQRGDRVRITVPVLWEKGWPLVRALREVTLGRCDECGKLFDGPSGKELCSAACWQRRNRRVRSGA